jgi:hypothetical protein
LLCRCKKSLSKERLSSREEKEEEKSRKEELLVEEAPKRRRIKSNTIDRCFSMWSSLAPPH